MSDITDTLQNGSSEQKIQALESLIDVSSPNIIEHVIVKLNDDDIRVRGEAFSLLLLNKSEKISKCLIKSLNSTNKNIRGFASLALANRNDRDAIPELIRLSDDEHSTVRSCAIGALGHLGAGTQNVQDTLYNALFDKNAQVKKSAAQAIIKAGITIPTTLHEKITDEWSDEIQKDPNLALLLDKLCIK